MSAEGDIRAALIAAGVKNLKAFGYPSANAESILADHVYKAFFNRMLQDEGSISRDPAIERVRLALVKETAP